MFRQILMLAWALCARIVVSLDCEELAAQCREYGKQEHLTLERLMSLSIPWPLTGRFCRNYHISLWAKPFAVFLCALIVNAGASQILQPERALRTRPALTRCPEFLADNPSGWYDSEMLVAMGRLCATSIAPVKYFRADTLPLSAGPFEDNY
ncbi:uncharacterized protein LOC129601414 [Paramacrobiotus metropolitanus]|uniref:uncharacterized protein LOC129601414 n=1 Tax=Paramacrobiotus metropolitanus TaxID=2943436 RepID=UPI0024462E33|nr:uncharacterized protein LOC129601414 [Paramacrobiotus metropolitanus]